MILHFFTSISFMYLFYIYPTTKHLIINEESSLYIRALKEATVENVLSFIT